MRVGLAGLRIAERAADPFLRARDLRSTPARSSVLVYQMAKVGSTSVARSIRRSRPGRPVFHVHSLTPEGVAGLERFYRNCRVPALPWAAHLVASRHLMRRLQDGVTPGSWKVVTLVRDPIARNLSLMFQVGPRLIPGFRRLCDAGTLDPAEIFARFEALFPSQVRCMSWFEAELERALDIDLFAVPFDRRTGWQVYAGPVADVLLIRTDRLSAVGERALRHFLGLRSLRLRTANVRSSRLDANRYQGFLDRVVLPGSVVDRFYDSDEVRHFFSPPELDRLRARWCGGKETA